MNQFVEELSLLTGQKPEWSPPDYLPSKDSELFGGGGLSYSQLNECLLALSYDRVSRGFFNYFMCPDTKKASLKDVDQDKTSPFRIESIEELKVSVDEFRKLAMLKYGNYKFAFKQLSGMNWDEINEDLEEFQPVQAAFYKNRPVPIVDSEQIERGDTYLLGYIAGAKAHTLRADREQRDLTPEEEALIARTDEVVRKGLRNYHKAITDDYMDVYIATSMRRREDFYAVYDFVQNVFNNSKVLDLKLRYFDPTQADPQDKLSKGLVEGLMVKRAKCTIYCAQESDTFGKDSELAATLAQGKPVIAYVPKINNLSEYKSYLRELLKECAEGDDVNYLRGILVERHPRCIVENPELVDIKKKVSHSKMIDELSSWDKRLYDGRAKVLQEIHPLSLQINLESGVANGVIVVRSIDECARVLRGIMLRDLDFEIVEVLPDEGDYKNYILRERITGSAFRVVTGDPKLTNSFWNFYLPKVP